VAQTAWQLPQKQASGYNPTFRYGKRDSSTSGTGSPHNGTSWVQSHFSRKDCTPNVRPNNLPPCPASPLGHFLCPLWASVEFYSFTDASLICRWRMAYITKLQRSPEP